MISVTVNPRPVTGTNRSRFLASDTTIRNIIAANSARKGLSIYNGCTTATLTIRLGADSANTFSVVIQPDGYYEVPYGFTGAVYGQFSSAEGVYAQITEFTL